MHRLGAALLTCLAGVAGCNNNNTTEVVTSAEATALDVTNAVSWESGIFWAAAQPFDPFPVATVAASPTIANQATAIDVNVAAEQVAKAVDNFFTPSGCAVAGANANVVTYQFGGCQGPFGISTASGSVTATYTTVQGGVQITLSSSNFQTVGTAITIAASALYTGSGARRQLAVATNGGGTGVRGSSVARQGQYTIVWAAGGTCVNIDGAVASTPGGPDVTTIAGYQTCLNGCPRAGKVIHVDTQTGETVTTTFDGSSSVNWSSTTGQAATANLSC